MLDDRTILRSMLCKRKEQRCIFSFYSIEEKKILIDQMNSKYFAPRLSFFSFNYIVEQSFIIILTINKPLIKNEEIFFYKIKIFE
jgi:hypothetical protein